MVNKSNVETTPIGFPFLVTKACAYCPLGSCVQQCHFINSKTGLFASVITDVFGNNLFSRISFNKSARVIILNNLVSASLTGSDLKCPLKMHLIYLQLKKFLIGTVLGS